MTTVQEFISQLNQEIGMPDAATTGFSLFSDWPGVEEDSCHYLFPQSKLCDIISMWIDSLEELNKVRLHQQQRSIMLFYRNRYLYHSIPQYTTVYHNTPHYIAVYHSIPQHTTVYHSIPQHTTVYHSILQYITVYHTISQYTTVYHSISQYTTTYYSISQYITVYHNILQ